MWTQYSISNSSRLLVGLSAQPCQKVCVRCIYIAWSQQLFAVMMTHLCCFVVVVICSFLLLIFFSCLAAIEQQQCASYTHKKGLAEKLRQMMGSYRSINYRIVINTLAGFNRINFLYLPPGSDWERRGNDSTNNNIYVEDDYWIRITIIRASRKEIE